MAGQGPVGDVPSVFDDEEFSGRGVVRIASVAALGGLLFGYDSAVINGAVDPIQKHFGINNASLGFAVASALLGAAAGQCDQLEIRSSPGLAARGRGGRWRGL